MMFCYCRVLRRIISLITLNAQLEAKSEAAIKQAESASRAAQVNLLAYFKRSEMLISLVT